ncbi:MAG: nuclear transport factor 2 family protein [Desulfobacterales bacterium]
MKEKIEMLMDMEAIKRLKYTYCYLADAGIAGDASKMDELVSWFTEDAWVDFSEFGIHQGKESISVFYKEIVAGALSYSAHMVSNPIIDIDGHRAHGKWYVFVPCTLRQTETAAWLQGKYEEDYRKIEGRWYWQSMTARFDFISPFDEGWVKHRMINNP